MEYVSKFISAAIGLSLLSATTGQLPRAMLWLITQVPAGGPQLISLTKLNRSLVGETGVGRHHRRDSERFAF